MAKNEVVETKTNAVAAATPLVQVDPADIMIPFLKVIQSLADEVTPGKDKYNENVRPGDIYDSVTKTAFKEADVIVCGLRKYYAEWTPEVRGQLVGKHKADSKIVTTAEKVEKVSDKGKPYFTLKTLAGNDLIETYGVAMLVKNPSGFCYPAVLTLSKTSYIVGKQLSAQIMMLQQQGGIPVFTLRAQTVSNSKGSWFKPDFTPKGAETDENVLRMAHQLAENAEAILFNVAAETGNDANDSSDVETIEAVDVNEVF